MKTLQPSSLPAIFRDLASHRFAVMKSLPEACPKPGSDIDLLCEDAVELGRALLRNCRELIAQGYELRIRQLPETSQTHIDLMLGDQIQLRLDLHEGLGCYPSLTLREPYARCILDRAQPSRLQTPDGPVDLPMPDAADNLVLRYLEYHAFFDGRPDKIKHAQAIVDQTANDPALRQQFFDRLAQAMTKRPSKTVLKHCDFNAKRQITWAYWSVRDKIAWRVVRVKQLAMMALTEPGVFLRKLTHKLMPGTAKRHGLPTEAH